MRRLLLFVMLLFVLAGCSAPVSPALPPMSSSPPVPETTAPADPYAEREAVVFRVVDGDTIDVDPGKGGSQRILGIDSPETVDPSLPIKDGHRVPQCGGPESTSWARSQLSPGMKVKLVPDRSQDSIDIYDRPLVYVRYQLPGQTEWLDFSVESVKAGMAKSFVWEDKPVQEFDKIVAAEKAAKQDRLGLWSCPENLPQ